MIVRADLVICKLFRRRRGAKGTIVKSLHPGIVEVDRNLQPIGQTVLKFGSSFELIETSPDLLVPPRLLLFDFLRVLRQQVGGVDEAEHRLLGRRRETDQRERDRESQAAAQSSASSRFTCLSIAQRKRRVIARRPRLPQPGYAPIESVPIVSIMHCQPHFGSTPGPVDWLASDASAAKVAG